MAGKPTEEAGMALDQWQARQVAQIRQGHLDVIGTPAASAAEYAGYVSRDAGRGAASHFAAGIIAYAQEITRHSAAIEVIDQIAEIAATGELT
jgi:hypothetical protein